VGPGRRSCPPRLIQIICPLPYHQQSTRSQTSVMIDAIMSRRHRVLAPAAAAAAAASPSPEAIGEA
jgi:hypothetical protein